jgi:uncharacterized repeat protein (TIGR01451 family)
MTRKIVSMRSLMRLLVRSGYAILFPLLFPVAISNTLLAQTAPPLGTAQSFAVLGASTVTNTGPTIVTGNLGVSPGSAVTGFPIYAADAVASQAQSDSLTAYNNLAGQSCTTTFGDVAELGGLTLVPGVYCFPSSAGLTGTLTLDAQGNPNAVWVFKIASTLITASDSTVLLVNGAQQCNVFWQVGSSATLGTGSTFVGNIFAYASITLTTDASVAGRTLAQTAAVTMDSNTVTVAACAVPPPANPIPPTVSKAFSPATIAEDGVSTLTITLSNSDSAAATGASFTDALPTGVTISGTGSTTCSGTLAASSGGTSVNLTGSSIPAGGSCTVTVPVTASTAGGYINSILAGALQSSNGSNTAPAVASLTVTAPATVLPTLSKAFSPATIAAGSPSTLTITLSNTDSAAATGASFTDTLPPGVTISSTGSNGCGGSLTDAVGSSSVSLAGLVGRGQLCQHPASRGVTNQPRQ